VDDCTWVIINFTSQREFKVKARTLLDQVHPKLTVFGFSMDEGKTEVARSLRAPNPVPPRVRRLRTGNSMESPCKE
jgi:hypothetical protein